MHSDTVTIDCERCQAPAGACGDCVVSVLLGAPADGLWRHRELAAVAVLADAGLVPPLRLVDAAQGTRRDWDGPGSRRGGEEELRSTG